VRQDLALQPEIARVFGVNFEVYGARKVWLQLNWEGLSVARCAVARLMRGMGLRGVICGRRVRDAGVGRLVQPPAADGTNRRHASAEAEERFYAMLDEPAMAA
jgi:putative transposase